MKSNAEFQLGLSVDWNIVCIFSSFYLKKTGWSLLNKIKHWIIVYVKQKHVFPLWQNFVEYLHIWFPSVPFTSNFHQIVRQYQTGNLFWNWTLLAQLVKILSQEDQFFSWFSLNHYPFCLWTILVEKSRSPSRPFIFFSLFRWSKTEFTSNIHVVSFSFILVDLFLYYYQDARTFHSETPSFSLV